MLIEGEQLKIQRVEVVKKVYDKQNRIIEEIWEFYFPDNKTGSIGYAVDSKKERRK